MDSAKDSFTIGNCFIAACVAGPILPSWLILAPAAINLPCNANTLGSPFIGFVFCVLSVVAAMFAGSTSLKSPRL